MKTVTLFLLLVLSNNLVASDIHWEALILKKMLTSMATKKEIKIYIQDEQLHKIYKKMDNILVTDNCKKADFVLANKELYEPCKKPEIVFSYDKFKNDPNAVGVFFWQKGRPTIRFSSKRLQYFGLEVRGELLKFVSSKK